MQKLDDLNKPISVIILNMNGYERLAMYGARETIKKYKPVIILNNNPFQRISHEFIKKFKVPEEVQHFDIIDFCKENGYSVYISTKYNKYAIMTDDRYNLYKHKANKIFTKFGTIPSVGFIDVQFKEFSKYFSERYKIKYYRKINEFKSING
jgi:hypothetical protein